VGITRRFIFPTVRIILWAVIAVALVKMAFTGADITPVADPLSSRPASRAQSSRRRPGCSPPCAARS
jgi:hypothetical protein